MYATFREGEEMITDPTPSKQKYCHCETDNTYPFLDRAAYLDAAYPPAGIQPW